MKKILVFSLLLVFISASASAQIRPRGRGTVSNFKPQNNQITWSEKKDIRKDAVRYQLMKRKASRDGVVTPFERRKLRKAKCETRRDLVRFKHNGRRRVI